MVSALVHPCGSTESGKPSSAERGGDGRPGHCSGTRTIVRPHRARHGRHAQTCQGCSRPLFLAVRAMQTSYVKGPPRVLELPDRQARLIINSAVDYAIVGLDCTGVITSWNMGAVRVMDWEPAAVIGQPASLFFTPEDVEADVPAALKCSAKTARDMPASSARLATGQVRAELWWIAASDLASRASASFARRPVPPRSIGWKEPCRVRTVGPGMTAVSPRVSVTPCRAARLRLHGERSVRLLRGKAQSSQRRPIARSRPGAMPPNRLRQASSRRVSAAAKHASRFDGQQIVIDRLSAADADRSHHSAFR